MTARLLGSASRAPLRGAALDRLGAAGWLARAPDRFRNAVLARCGVTAYGRGAVVVRAGAEARGLWAVVSGVLTREAEFSESGPCLTDIVIPGSWFGEETMLDEVGCAATFRASCPSVVAHLPRRDLDAILAADAEGWRCLCLLLHANLARATERADMLAIRDAPSRVAAILLRFAEAEATAVAPTFEMPQADLATLAGMARSSLHRALATLKAAGLISLRYRRICVQDPQRLRAFAAREP